MKDRSEIYEKVGLFYLGKDLDPQSLEPTKALTLIKNKNFTTHAAILGMTGSGKTGLGIGIIEEAALDNIPAIVIDPKGDMGDLLLTDPEFRPESFLPWVEGDARSKGIDAMELAKKTALQWKEGIESWEQSPERVRRFASVPKTIYTPGSRAGVSVDLVSSLEVPPAEILEESDSLASYLKSTVSGLLALLKIEADPMESKEYILLAQILSRAWSDGENLGIEALVGRILQPPFSRVGVLPLESFYPERERFKLATRFNALLASPDFLNWMGGESLEIQNLLYDGEGRAKISIFSIAHLSDSERMFFVTLLLNRFTAWMRRQSGSGRLRTLLYMDEIYGYFPPVKNPPSKEPMISLLKQARAYGVGIVLSTQNPVDLDYKGLSNIGTWFIGRLQTRQDIERVIDGLEGKLGSEMDRKEIATLLGNLKTRNFFLRSAHLDGLRLFSTRWVLSYLKGPLKKEEIRNLMGEQKSVGEDESPSGIPLEEGWGNRPRLGSGVEEFFEVDPTGKNRYRPYLAAKIHLEFHDQRRGLDLQRGFFVWLDLFENSVLDWGAAERSEEGYLRWPQKAPSRGKYRPIPPFLTNAKDVMEARRELRDRLYREERLELYRCRRLRMESSPEEREGEFRARVREALKEKKEDAIETLKERYAKKEERILDQLRRAQSRVEKEKTDQTSTLISVGASILGALFGKPTASKIGTAVNRSGRILKDRGDISRAQEKVEELEGKLQALEEELGKKIEELAETYDLREYPIDSFSLRPRKSDIEVEAIALAWRAEI